MRYLQAVGQAADLVRNGRVEIGGRKLPRTKVLQDVYRVEFFDTKDLRRGRAAVRRCGGTILDAAPPRRQRRTNGPASSTRPR